MHSVSPSACINPNQKDCGCFSPFSIVTQRQSGDKICVCQICLDESYIPSQVSFPFKTSHLGAYPFCVNAGFDVGLPGLHTGGLAGRPGQEACSSVLKLPRSDPWEATSVTPRGKQDNQAEPLSFSGDCLGSCPLVTQPVS